jgi:superfamily II DNA or RNA helicase
LSNAFINLRRLQEGTWQAFERMIARYIEHGGFLDVTIVGGTGDLGADIVGSFKGKRWVLQAKFRTSVNTGKAAVIEAFTAHWSYDADVIVAATNKKFTDDALQYRAQRVREGFQVYLWDQSFFLAQFDNLSEYSAARREPRPYQRTAINALHDASLAGKSKALITLATGLGKTIVASTFVAEYLENNPDAKVLFLAHMTDLVKQLERASWSQFSKYTDTHVWTDGEIPVYVDGVTFATWQSVVSAYRNGISLEGQYDLVVVDECHHAPSESFNDLLNYLEPKFLVGVTATPWRGDGESLRPLFGDPVFSMDVVEGMQQGFLAEVDYLMLIDGIDWDEIRELSREGLSVKDLNQRLYVPERDIGMIETICQTIEATINPRTLVFCRSIPHAERIQKFFRQFDISAGVLHSELHRSERFRTLTDFRSGKLKVLISIEMLNEGIDVPEVNIVVFARVTHSRRIFLQQLGRGLRISSTKKQVKVLDFVADVRRVAAGIEINNSAQRYKSEEEVRYPSGEIIKFTRHSQNFFQEYLADMANISDLDENAHLNFPI